MFLSGLRLTQIVGFIAEYVRTLLVRYFSLSTFIQYLNPLQINRYDIFNGQKLQNKVIRLPWRIKVKPGYSNNAGPNAIMQDLRILT